MQQRLAKQAEPAVVLTLILALLAGGLAAICVALGDILRSGRSWLKLEPQPLDFEAFFGLLFIGAIVAKGLWELLTRSGFSSKVVHVLASGLVSLSLSVGLFIVIGGVIVFVVEVIRRQIRSAIYEGKVLILGWWCFVCGLLAWELGIILPPMMWVLGSITIFPYVLDKRFVWQVAEADTEKLAK